MNIGNGEVFDFLFFLCYVGHGSSEIEIGCELAGDCTVRRATDFSRFKVGLFSVREFGFGGPLFDEACEFFHGCFFNGINVFRIGDRVDGEASIVAA